MIRTILKLVGAALIVFLVLLLSGIITIRTTPPEPHDTAADPEELRRLLDDDSPLD